MLVGLVGCKRVGKDTFANYLVRKHGFVKKSLAYPMKRIACEIFGWTMEWIEEHKEEVDPEYGISPRQFLQDFGTNYMQTDLGSRYPQYSEVTGRQVWVKRLIKHLAREYTDTSSRIVVTDIRFIHEVYPLKACGFSLVKIIRDTGISDSHPSEQDIPNIKADFEVYNNGVIEELGHMADSIVHCQLYPLKPAKGAV